MKSENYGIVPIKRNFFLFLWLSEKENFFKKKNPKKNK